jgi:hypothetical protein
MKRTSHVVAAVLMVVTGGPPPPGWPTQATATITTTRGHYYSFGHHGYYNDNSVGRYEGNEGNHHSDYNTDGPNGVDSDNECDLTRYENGATTATAP